MEMEILKIILENLNTIFNDDISYNIQKRSSIINHTLLNYFDNKKENSEQFLYQIKGEISSKLDNKFDKQSGTGKRNDTNRDEIIKILIEIEKQAKENKIQIIIATHSPFALTCNANFIELQPGYIKIAKQEIELLGEILKLQEELKKAGVNPVTIRLSIGLEDTADLIEDLNQALNK